MERQRIWPRPSFSLAPALSPSQIDVQSDESDVEIDSESGRSSEQVVVKPELPDDFGGLFSGLEHKLFPPMPQQYHQGQIPSSSSHQNLFTNRLQGAAPASKYKELKQCLQNSNTAINESFKELKESMEKFKTHLIVGALIRDCVSWRDIKGRSIVIGKDQLTIKPLKPKGEKPIRIKLSKLEEKQWEKWCAASKVANVAKIKDCGLIVSLVNKWLMENGTSTRIKDQSDLDDILRTEAFTRKLKAKKRK